MPELGRLYDAATANMLDLTTLSGRTPDEPSAGLGVAVAFGIADAPRAARILDGAHRQPGSVVNVWPHLPPPGPRTGTPAGTTRSAGRS